MREMIADYSQSSDANGNNADEFEVDKEAVEAGARLGADAVGNTHDNEDKDGQQLVLDPVRLVCHAGDRVGTLDEDNTENGERRGHDGNDPCPRGKEAPDIAVDTLQEWLDTT
jgi:hypothetical protein